MFNFLVPIGVAPTLRSRYPVEPTQRIASLPNYDPTRSTGPQCTLCNMLNDLIGSNHFDTLKT